MGKEPIDLQTLWGLQEGQGHDARGRDLEIVVPSGDPEMGPYTGHRFLPSGGALPKGWRHLTPDEILEATGEEEDED